MRGEDHGSGARLLGAVAHGRTNAVLGSRSLHNLKLVQDLRGDKYAFSEQPQHSDGVSFEMHSLAKSAMVPFMSAV